MPKRLPSLIHSFILHPTDGECDISSPKIQQTYAELASEKNMTWYTEPKQKKIDFVSANDFFFILFLIV